MKILFALPLIAAALVALPACTTVEAPTPHVQSTTTTTEESTVRHPVTTSTTETHAVRSY